MLKRTPLYEAHIKLGAKMVDFGGWAMPLQYSSIIEEHLTVRKCAGIFDISHMGEIIVRGKDAKLFLDKLVTCNLNTLPLNKIAYTFFLNENGGVLDDLPIYAIKADEYFLVVNASNTEKIYKWLMKNMRGNVEITDYSDEYGMLALQGPRAQKILQRLTNSDLNQIGFFRFGIVKLCGINVMISRTGYTGEDGFEIYCDTLHTVEIWSSILEEGSSDGIKPIGLGARDTLRLEAALSLYGHELNEEITPIEAGLGFFIKPDKGDYIGREVIEKQIAEGIMKRIAGIELIDKGIPRAGYRIEKASMDIGYVTSGVWSPTFQKGLAMAMLSTKGTPIGSNVDILIRDKKIKGKIVEIPFYSQRKRNVII